MAIRTPLQIPTSGVTNLTRTGFLKREEILGKAVVGQDTLIIGTFKDLTVSIDSKIALHVEKKRNVGGKRL